MPRFLGFAGVMFVLILTLEQGRMSEAQTDFRCFAETGHCIAGPVRAFWERHGGLPVFGLPITPLREEQVEGRGYQVQWFERARFELHPENGPPYDVLLGRLDAQLLAGVGPAPALELQAQPEGACRDFAETGQQVCGPILAAWRANGLEFDGRRGVSEAESLALFGLPVSPLETRTLADGRSYQVQWFERARFELHPENAPPYDVLLGLLGADGLPQPGAPAREHPRRGGCPGRPAAAPGDRGYRGDPVGLRLIPASATGTPRSPGRAR